MQTATACQQKLNGAMQLEAEKTIYTQEARIWTKLRGIGTTVIKLHMM